jgi:chorismate mutase
MPAAPAVMERIRTVRNSSAAPALQPTQALRRGLYDPPMRARRRRADRLRTVRAGLLLLAWAAAVQAQTPPARPRTPRPNMQAMNEALGVKCAYCHVPADRRPDELDYRSDANPKKRIARMMVAMTADINASIPAAVLKSTEDSTVVTCATCHRGVPDPRPLAEILARAIEQDGLEEGVIRYRALRARYFGRDAYDFSERTLLTVAQRLVERAPESALALMRMNLEFNPASADSYVMMAHAETRRLDDRAAIVHLEKALELSPDHGLAQGFLAQLRQFTKPRR